MRHKEQSTERNTDKGFLRTEPLGRLLLKLALPTVAAQLINMLYNIVDRIYIGHIPEIGATALTGVGVCMPLIMIVSAFAALVGYGGAPRASIFMGKQDKESAEKKTFLKIKRKNLRLVPKIILPCLALGVATFIMQASESVISVCFNSSLQKYGGDIAVGAMTILTSVMQFAMLPLQGLGQGAQPIISYSYGAGDQDRVRAAFKLLLKVSLGYSVFLWLLVMALPGGFAAMFTSDARLMEYTRTALRIYMGSMFLFGIQMACQMTFNALGKAKEVHCSGGYEKICPSDPFDLYHASDPPFRSDYGSLYGGAYCRSAGCYIYRSSLWDPV